MDREKEGKGEGEGEEGEESKTETETETQRLSCLGEIGCRCGGCVAASYRICRAAEIAISGQLLPSGFHNTAWGCCASALQGRAGKQITAKQCKAKQGDEVNRVSRSDTRTVALK